MSHYNRIIKKIKTWGVLLYRIKDVKTEALIMKKNSLSFIFTILTIIFVAEILILTRFENVTIFTKTSQCCSQNYTVNSFENFNNETGTPDGCYIVPNIVHFIRFKGYPVSYIHMICYLAAFKNQKPDIIYFHYDNRTTFSGKYWNILRKTPGFMDVVKFNYVKMPSEIFGQELAEGWTEFHGSDITRIRMLMKYGGIFLDNDSYLVRSLNDFRRYEMAIGWDDGGQFLGTQIIVANKNARFLNLWLETYRDAYRADEWYYNAGERPTVEVLYKKPELVHRVKYLFGVHNSLVSNIYRFYWPQWRYMYALHLLHRHLYTLGSFEHELPKVFDENNVKNHGNTFREMALDVYNPDNAQFQYSE